MGSVSGAGAGLYDATLSIAIKSGGKNRKSTASANAIVIAVIFPMSAFIPNAEVARIEKPITRITDVTASARPTVVNA